MAAVSIALLLPRQTSDCQSNSDVCESIYLLSILIGWFRKGEETSLNGKGRGWWTLARPPLNWVPAIIHAK